MASNWLFDLLQDHPKSYRVSSPASDEISGLQRERIDRHANGYYINTLPSPVLGASTLFESTEFSESDFQDLLQADMQKFPALLEQAIATNFRGLVTKVSNSLPQGFWESERMGTPALLFTPNATTPMVDGELRDWLYEHCHQHFEDILAKWEIDVAEVKYATRSYIIDEWLDSEPITFSDPTIFIVVRKRTGIRQRKLNGSWYNAIKDMHALIIAMMLNPQFFELSSYSSQGLCEKLRDIKIEFIDEIRNRPWDIQPVSFDSQFRSSWIREGEQHTLRILESTPVIDEKWTSVQVLQIKFDQEVDFVDSINIFVEEDTHEQHWRRAQEQIERYLDEKGFSSVAVRFAR